MRRIGLLASLLVALALAMAAPASAGPAVQLALIKDSVDLQYPVEQESPNFTSNNCAAYPANPACDPSTWVSNPTACAWDIDDHIVFDGNGDLAAGASVAASLCIMGDGYNHWDGDPHVILVTVTAPVPTLSVVLSSDQGVSWSASPVRAASWNGYVWSLCVADPHGTLSSYPVVAESNGGTGSPANYTLSIAAGAKAVRSVSAKYWAPGTIQTNC